MKQVTSSIPSIDFQMFTLPHLKHLNFTDDNSFEDRPVDLILGAESFSLILRTGVRREKRDEPVVQRTTLK